MLTGREFGIRVMWWSWGVVKTLVNDMMSCQRVGLKSEGGYIGFLVGKIWRV